MANGAPNQFLAGLKVLFGAITVTMAALSQTLIRTELIPEQIKFVGSIGAFFIIIALLFTLGYHQQLRTRLAIWLGTALFVLLVLVIFQVRYVVTLGSYGGSSTSQNYLVGFSLTDEGNQMREALGRNKSESEFIEEMGVDRIPVAYGSSYYIIAALYSISYIVFVFVTVLALGSVIIPKPGGG